MLHRWTDLDTDDHRLPHGFTRAGYDSNTRRYHFRDAEGCMYQGEPGEEFGGHLTPMNGIDPSMRHRFAPDDDQVNGRNPVDNARNPEMVSTVQARPTAQPVPTSPSSFSDFLSSSQMAAAPSPDPPKKNSLNRGFTSSFRRVTTLARFRSTKSKPNSATLTNPSSNVDEWGRTKF